MDRREFLKASSVGLGILAFPLVKSHPPCLTPQEPSPSLKTPDALRISGSPYLGHSDYRKHFRGLSLQEIHREIVHFRTEEPWRRILLFEV